MQFGLSLIELSFIAVIGLPVIALTVGVSLRFPNLRNTSHTLVHPVTDWANHSKNAPEAFQDQLHWNN